MTVPPDTDTAPIVNLRTVYNEVVKVKETLTSSNIPDMKTGIKDHENRIRELERWVWRASGLAALAGAGLSQIIDRVINR